MIDLKLTEDEKARMANPEPMEYPSIPDYPYGMVLSLHSEVLAKLKSPSLAPGSIVSFSVEAFVTSAAVDDEGKPSHVCFQVRSMTKPKTEEEPSNIMYGD